MSRAIELISEMIVDSFTGVLSTRQFDVGECEHLRVAAPRDYTSDGIVALLEFSGPELHGFLQLFLLEDCADPLVLYDAGELVNQVAGRLSNRLYNCGFNIRTSTPRIVRSGVFEAEKDLTDAEVFITTSSERGWRLKTVISPVSAVEQLANRVSEQRPSALKESTMVLFGGDKPCG